VSKHLQREIENLKRSILALGALVEENFQRSVRAIEQGDADLAQKVIDSDLEIDHVEVDVEEDCLKIFALHQPVAVDLRFIVAILKLNSDLERIGDLAVNVAEEAIYLADVERPDLTQRLGAMAGKVQWMVKTSLDALVNSDPGLARLVCAEDDDVDDMHRAIISEVKDAARSDPGMLDPLLRIMTVSHQLERVADHTTNIAEDVIYMVQGEIIRHGSNRKET
jgi:phosphate transport system protein